jgi:hypothetical protein
VENFVTELRSVPNGAGSLRPRSMVNGRRVDLLAAYNAAHDPDLGADVGWEPTLHGRIDPVWAVPFIVATRAGAGRAVPRTGR